MREGEHLCPEGWGDQHVLYEKIEDTRECSACTCSAPNGGTCEVLASVWRSAGCSQIGASNAVFAGMIPPCIDVMPGIAMASKSAELVSYTKGTCAPSGGDVKGELVLDNPTTVCCYLPVM
jgi:hypothetical protein